MGSLLRGESAPADETDVDREIAHNLWKHHRMLPPRSRFKHHWDYVMVILVLYNIVLTPMQFGFARGHAFIDSAAVLLVVDVVIWFLFVVDLVVNFRTSFYDEDHQIVLSKAVVAKRYWNGWFMWDLVATLPYHLVGAIVTVGQSDSNRVLIVGLCKIPVCSRLLRLSHKLDELTSVGYFRVVLQMFGFMMVAHWVACLWWMIGESHYAVEESDGQTFTSWLRRVPHGSTELFPDVSKTPFAQQYMSSMYWSLTTLMKTPWVGPDTVAEKVYASFMVVVGATLFAMLLGSVTAMINTYNKRHSELRDQLTTLHTFATFRRVPAGLQRKMFAYVDAYWNMTAGLDNSSILNQLPPRLRTSVLLAMHGSLLNDCAILRNCSEACATTLLLKAKPQVILQKEDLLVPGQLCAELYILITGSLQITLPLAADDDRALEHGATDDADGRASAASFTRSTGSKSTSAALKGNRLRFRPVEKPGQIVGLSEPFQQPTTYPFRVAALKSSQMIFITRQDLADVLSIFHGPDADAVCHVLRNDFLVCFETLKPRGRPKHGSVEAEGAVSLHNSGLAVKRARELAELRTKLTDLDRRLEGCMGSIGTVQSQTARLTQLQETLNALVQAHTT